MDKLFAELQRLYLFPGQDWCINNSEASDEVAASVGGVLTPEIVANCFSGAVTLGLNLVSADGIARAMVVDFKKATDSEQVAKLYQAFQNDLDLPAPAVSVSGNTGYRLWVSLVEPVPVEQAHIFLQALRLKYLPDVTDANLCLRPKIDNSTAATQDRIELAPARHLATGKWSAFIDPSMVSMFIDGPWLEMAPNMDKQADILTRLVSIKTVELERALTVLQAKTEQEVSDGVSSGDESASKQREAISNSLSGAAHTRSELNVGNNYSDPQSFLLAVMNDSSADAHQRIRAAKALLPYFS